MLHELHVSGPLDLETTFTCGQCFRWRRDGAAWSGVIAGGEIRATHPRSSTLLLEVRGADPGRDRLIEYFRLDEDPRWHLAGAEELALLPGFLPLLGLRLLRQDPWETLASFIGSAAANLRKITAGVEGVAARWGDPIEGSERRSFPPPGRLARARESELRALGLGFRAPYVLGTARRLASRDWSWQAVREAEYEEAVRRLTSLPGVGRKIADCVLLFALDRLTAYPVDRWVRRATLELSSRRSARDEDLARWAERFGPGRGYLQQILFHLRRTSGRPFPPLERRRARRRRSA